MRHTVLRETSRLLFAIEKNNGSAALKVECFAGVSSSERSGLFKKMELGESEEVKNYPALDMVFQCATGFIDCVDILIEEIQITRMDTTRLDWIFGFTM